MENQIEKIQAPTPVMLLSQAIEKGLNLESLEKFMDLQDRWEKKEAEKSFRSAMTKFQSNKPELKKGETAKMTTKSGGTVSYNYNAISTIQRVIDPVLSSCGLTYRWEQSQANNKIRVTCIVSHVDGHSESTWIEADSDQTGAKNNIQAIGSTITYLKRYTLEGALGLASGEDKDATDLPKKQNQPGVTAKEVPEKSMDELHKEYMLLLKEYRPNISDEEASPLDPDNWNKRTPGAYKYAINQLTKKLHELNTPANTQ